MNQLRTSLVIVVIPFLLFAANAQVSDQNLCKEGFLQVVTPDALSVSTNQCRAVAKQTMAAWRFDAEQMHWTNPSATEYALTLRLLSVARMKAEFGRNAFTHHLLEGRQNLFGGVALDEVEIRRPLR